MSPSTLPVCAAVAGVVRRDARLYFSYRTAFLGQCFALAFSVTLFYYVSRLVAVDSFGSPDRYFAFVVVGLVILQAITGTLGILPFVVRQELLTGTFERIVLSPFGAVAAVLSMIVFPFLRAVLFGVLMLLFALVAGLYFPVALLPDWIEWASYVQPFTPAVDLLRHVLIGTALTQSALVEAARLAGFATLLVPVGVLAVAQALRFGQRTGTVCEF